MCGDIYDCEMGEVSSMAWHRSRKERKCQACGRRIERGELYHKTSLLHDGKWSVTVNCARCWAIVEHLWTVVEPETAVALRLDCGVEYEGDEDDPGHALAFMTDAEAQAWALNQLGNTDAGGSWSF